MVLLFCLPYPIKFGMSPGRMLLGVLMFVFNEAWGVFLSKKPNQTKSSGLAALRETSERRLRLDGPTILAELAMSWNVLDDWIECKLWHLNLEKDKAKRERKKERQPYLPRRPYTIKMVIQRYHVYCPFTVFSHGLHTYIILHLVHKSFNA